MNEFCDVSCELVDQFSVWREPSGHQPGWIGSYLALRLCVKIPLAQFRFRAEGLRHAQVAKKNSNSRRWTSEAETRGLDHSPRSKGHVDDVAASLDLQRVLLVGLAQHLAQCGKPELRRRTPSYREDFVA